MSEFSLMIVDDQEADRYLLKRALKKADIKAEIFESTNGDEALAFFQDYKEKKSKFGSKFPPLVIFLDINMPKVDGFEFLEEFDKLRKGTEGYSSCVIMMFSSSERPEDRDKAFSFDFVKDFITKGESSPEELKEKILKVAESA